MERAIRVALLEQELRLCQVQLTEATRINAELTGLHSKEAERVFTLVQELAYCERRSAKAEIAVEYLSELNVQNSVHVKQHIEPDRRILTLEKELQNVKHDAEMRIAVLEIEKQSLSQDNEKLKSKLENAMDTILALFSNQEFIKTAKNLDRQGSHSAGAKDQHNNLVDLMDDCLTPIKTHVNEEATTLLNDSYDPEDDDGVLPTVETPHVLSDSSHSDFSTSSYIVRFKGVRDMRTHGRIVNIPTVVRTQSPSPDS